VNVRLVETEPGRRYIAVDRPQSTLLLAPNCTADIIVGSGRVGFECGLVDLIGAIDQPFRMPLPCMVYADARRRESHRYVCRINRWFNRAGEFTIYSDDRLGKLHFGESFNAVVKCALHYARTDLQPLGVTWEAVPFWRSSRNDEHWCKNALRESLRKRQFEVPRW